MPGPAWLLDASYVTVSSGGYYTKAYRQSGKFSIIYNAELLLDAGIVVAYRLRTEVQQIGNLVDRHTFCPQPENLELSG